MWIVTCCCYCHGDRLLNADPAVKCQSVEERLSIAQVFRPDRRWAGRGGWSGNERLWYYNLLLVRSREQIGSNGRARYWTTTARCQMMDDLTHRSTRFCITLLFSLSLLRPSIPRTLQSCMHYISRHMSYGQVFITWEVRHTTSSGWCPGPTACLHLPPPLSSTPRSARGGTRW